jgi:hypothetical protein
MALAPRSDQRVEEIVAAHPIFGEFLSRFTDQFGYKVDPTILLARADKPHLTDVEAVAGFRDLVALSIVPYSRAQDLLRPHSWVGVLYGDALAFYPWIIDMHYERLVQRTPAVLSNGPEVHELSGQSSPGLPSGNLAACDIDQPLLDALLKRWRGRYDENVGEDIALFRSLNMAYHASLMPAQTTDTFYDRGRLIALWVSAFEILVHPGSGGDANKKKVLELLARVSGKPDSETEGHGLRKQICAELYGRRNDFLHGNPVSPQALRFKQSGRDVGDYAAPLYRLALSAFLRLEPVLPEAPEVDAAVLSDCLDDYCYLSGYQRIFEEALLTAGGPPRGPFASRSAS